MSWSDLYDSARKAYREGKLDDASLMFSVLIGEYPDDSNLYYYRGSVYYKRKVYDLSISDYDKAISLDRMNQGLYQSRGIVHFEVGNYDQAERDFRYSRYLSKGKAKHDIYLGRIYLKQGKVRRAEEHFFNAIKSGNDSPTVRFYHGFSNMMMRNYFIAYNSFELVLKEKPNHLSSLFGIGRCCLEMATEGMRPSDIEVQEMPGLSKLQDITRDELLNKSVSALTTVIQMDPTIITAYQYRGEAYYCLGNHKSASSDFSQCIRMKPDNEEFYRLWLIAKDLL